VPKPVDNSYNDQKNTDFISRAHNSTPMNHHKLKVWFWEIVRKEATIVSVLGFVEKRE
jgi:hypothetical protein